MPKNLVLCCDGTANQFSKHNTNVVKLYSTLIDDPARQVTYYHPGLGTREPDGVLTTWGRAFTKVLGLAFGSGLEDDVRDAYVFLMRNYRPDDKVFLFGFSRGAYTVRAVASLLHMYGLIRPDNEPLVPYAIRMLLAVQKARGRRRETIDDYFDLANDFKAKMTGTPCKPWFVGVWDTVSSVGWVENQLKLPYTANNPDIEIGRHAVALDERRAFFRTNLWRRPENPAASFGPRDVKQVWFPGVHSDVGGGYPEEESGLAKIALEWMLDEAEPAGLLVDPGKRREVLGYAGDKRYVRPDPNATMHESLTGFWHVAEFLLKKHFDSKTRKESRRMNLYRRRTMPERSLVHRAAWDRGAEYAKRLPPDAVRVEGKPAGGA